MSSTINGAGLFTHSYARALTQMRRQFDNLNLQLATGQKSQDYMGLGADRSLALALRGKIASLGGYSTNIQQASLRTDVMLASLTGLTGIASDTRADLSPNNYILSGNQTIAQKAAQTRLDTAIEALNANVAGVYLFGGREVSSPPVASASQILDGIVGQEGLRTVISERRAADLGGDGRGRLTAASATGTNITLAESVSPNAFGFKLGAVSSNAPGAFSVSSASGTPPQIAVDIIGDPKPGDAIRVALTLPDGSTEEIRLVASNDPPAPELVAQINGSELASGVTGSTPLNDAALGLSAGDVITINGQSITLVSGPAGPDQIDISTATLDDLMTGIEGLTGIGSAEFDPVTRQIRVQSTNGTDLTVSGSMSAKLGLNGTFKASELERHTFQIARDALGAVDLAATAKNIASALDGAVRKEAATSLTAASAIQASRDFFGNPPMRVDGVPAETATGLVDGSANTIAWYRGESGPDSARQTQNARIDSTLNASYGARANEDGIREMLESLAVFAAMELDTANEQTGKGQYEALTTRLRPALASDTGLGPMEGIVIEITNVAAQIGKAKERHIQSDAVLKTMLADIESASKEEVAASILALQTNLQASYQVTAIASQLTLVNFL